MKDRGTLLYWSHWFHPLPLKKSHPSPSPFSPPPQTGKPLLNNIIAYFILTVTSARGKKAWLNHSGVLFSPLTADCALCVWVGDFDCSFFFFTRRCLHFFFFVWGELLLSCFSSSYSKQKTGEAEWEWCTFETALIVSLFTGRLIWNIWIREILRKEIFSFIFRLAYIFFCPFCNAKQKPRTPRPVLPPYTLHLHPCKSSIMLTKLN